MKNKFDFSQARPGDVLLYKPHSFFGYLISLKTWCATACHVEVYYVGGESVASRDGIGVNKYPTRHHGLSMVLRPKGEFHVSSAMKWFRTVRGQPYDYLGILVFGMLTEKGQYGKQICSEFARNFLTAGGIECFSTDYPSEKVPPSFFLTSLALERIY